MTKRLIPIKNLILILALFVGFFFLTSNINIQSLIGFDHNELTEAFGMIYVCLSLACMMFAVQIKRSKIRKHQMMVFILFTALSIISTFIFLTMWIEDMSFDKWVYPSFLGVLLFVLLMIASISETFGQAETNEENL